jgi:lysozyme family protein
MEDDFTRSLAFVLSAEGGFCDVPGDHGGATNHGIEQAEYSAWLGAQGLPDADVRRITDAQVAMIYRTRYWDAVHGDGVAWPLSIVLFDSAVNCGVGMALEWLNRGVGVGAARDWLPATSVKYHALDFAGIEALAERVLTLRRSFYVEIARRPEQGKFLKGWLARVARLRLMAGLG